MTDHLAHLRPADIAAQEAWQTHVHGSADQPACPQCSVAPGPPPPGCPPERRALYACDEGVRLLEAAVRAAQAAHREVHGG